MNEIVTIPRHTKQAAVQSLRALRERQGLFESEAAEVLEWLRETAIKPLRCWVGELAAFLLLDHAGPRVKARVWTLCQKARGWKLYFYLIVLMGENNRRRLGPHLRRARRSKETVIRAFAEHLLWEQHEPVDAAVAEAESR